MDRGDMFFRKEFRNSDRAMQLNDARYLFAALLIIAPAPAFGQQEDQYSAEWKKCIDAAGGSDLNMKDCNDAEAQRQDTKLNEVYKRLMSQLPPGRKKQLQEVQRLWIKYTDANCGFLDDPDGGTAARLAASSCVLQARTDKVQELEGVLENVGN
jgi:uncharacterized protein YecT (DUF1311 family)